MISLLMQDVLSTHRAEQTEAYLKEHSIKEYKTYEADEDAKYDEVIEIDLSVVRPTVAFPHLPGNAKTIDEIEAMEFLLDKIRSTKSNNEFFDMMRRAS